MKSYFGVTLHCCAIIYFKCRCCITSTCISISLPRYINYTRRREKTARQARTAEPSSCHPFIPLVFLKQNHIWDHFLMAAVLTSSSGFHLPLIFIICFSIINNLLELKVAQSGLQVTPQIGERCWTGDKLNSCWPAGTLDWFLSESSLQVVGNDSSHTGCIAPGLVREEG